MSESSGNFDGPLPQDLTIDPFSKEETVPWSQTTVPLIPLPTNAFTPTPYGYYPFIFPQRLCSSACPECATFATAFNVEAPVAKGIPHLTHIH